MTEVEALLKIASALDDISFAIGALTLVLIILFSLLFVKMK